MAIDDKQLAHIKARYEHMTAHALLGKQERERLHNQTIAALDRAQKLLEQFSEGFFLTEDDTCFDQDRTIEGVMRGLPQLKDCIVRTPVSSSPDLRGKAENFLVLVLARLIDNPTCGKSSYSGRYEGTFVRLLEDCLPRMGLDHLDIQALAKRYEGVRRRRAVS